MSPPIDVGRRALLARDGFVLLRDIISSTWLDHLAAALDAAIARPSPLGQQFARDGGAFYSDLYLSASFPAFRRFTRESDIGAALAAVTGLPRVVLFTDELLVKEARTLAETPWHHDSSYWPVAGEQIFSAWIPLDAVDAEGGALEFVRGSHRWNRAFGPVDFGSGAARRTRPEEEPLPDVDAVVPAEDRALVPCGPGDCLVFHGATLHRAAGNRRAERRRRAIVLRLVGPDVRFDPRPTTLPLIWGPRLAPGEPLDGDPLFPVLHPRTADQEACRVR